jgi:hypothetical protein
VRLAFSCGPGFNGGGVRGFQGQWHQGSQWARLGQLFATTTTAARGQATGFGFVDVVAVVQLTPVGAALCQLVSPGRNADHAQTVPKLSTSTSQQIPPAASARH